MTAEPEQGPVAMPTELPCDLVESTDADLELGPADRLAPSEEAAVKEWLHLAGAGTASGTGPTRLASW